MITRFLFHQIPTLIFVALGCLLYYARRHSIQDFTTADLLMLALVGGVVVLCFVRGLWNWVNWR